MKLATPRWWYMREHRARQGDMPMLRALLTPVSWIWAAVTARRIARTLPVDPGVPVICYGLRTDFRTRLFPGAQRLMELADRIEEVKVTCQYCAKKATCNLRFINGVPTVRGPQIQLGADEHYAPVCWSHYDEATRALAQDSSGAVVRPS